MSYGQAFNFKTGLCNSAVVVFGATGFGGTANKNNTKSHSGHTGRLCELTRHPGKQASVSVTEESCS